MPALKAADEAFLASAPKIYEETFRIDRPAAEVWAELTSDTPLHWCRALSIRWTSPRPFGVGTTREARILGVAKAKEHFFVWEEGRRKAFFLTHANLPIFTRLAEDYVVEPDGPDRCTFRWVIAVEPSALGKPGGPINGLLFKSVFDDTRKHFSAT